MITHAHIDHIGRIADLYAAGFDGPVLCTLPTARLLPVMLEDAWRLRGERGSLERFLARLAAHTQPLAYGERFEICHSGALMASLVLGRAGHVIGSA